jgi:hypothetical protein
MTALASNLTIRFTNSETSATDKNSIEAFVNDPQNNLSDAWKALKEAVLEYGRAKLAAAAEAQRQAEIARMNNEINKIGESSTAIDDAIVKTLALLNNATGLSDEQTTALVNQLLIRFNSNRDADKTTISTFVTNYNNRLNAPAWNALTQATKWFNDMATISGTRVTTAAIITTANAMLEPMPDTSKLAQVIDLMKQKFTNSNLTATEKEAILYDFVEHNLEKIDAVADLDKTNWNILKAAAQSTKVNDVVDIVNDARNATTITDTLKALTLNSFSQSQLGRILTAIRQKYANFTATEKKLLQTYFDSTTQSIIDRVVATSSTDWNELKAEWSNSDAIAKIAANLALVSPQNDNTINAFIVSATNLLAPALATNNIAQIQAIVAQIYAQYNAIQNDSNLQNLILAFVTAQKNTSGTAQTIEKALATTTDNNWNSLKRFAIAAATANASINAGDALAGVKAATEQALGQTGPSITAQSILDRLRKRTGANSN